MCIPIDLDSLCCLWMLAIRHAYIFLLLDGCAGLNKRRSLNAYIDRLPARRIRYEPFIFLYPIVKTENRIPHAAGNKRLLKQITGNSV